MPELPEVETIASQLDKVISNKIIDRFNVLNPGSFSGEADKVEGQAVKSVGRRAKTLIIKLANGLYLLVHLKMTGQLIYVSGEKRVAGGHPSQDFHDQLPNKHTRIVFEFNDGTKLFFNDLRKFGWIKLLTFLQMNEYFYSYGPDAVPEIDVNYLQKRAERMGRSNIKKFIMDQGVISGVGNIYADEALFEAKMAPTRLVSTLTSEEWKSLAQIIEQKLTFAIEKGGTTDNDYVNAYGHKGGMQDYLNVYHRTGEPCPRNCGGKIERIKLSGRGTHFCPVCQKDVS